MLRWLELGREGRRAALAAAVACCVIVAGFSPPSLADGTQTLGPPSISIAAGSGFVAAGKGLSDRAAGQPGTISINVPGAVQQALLYWEGANRSGDDYAASMGITVNGNPVTGVAIGGNTEYSTNWWTVSYRADVTELVSSGANALVVDGLDFTQVNDGAGVLVIYDDGSTSEIEVRDGNDYAFRSDLDPGPMGQTVPQTFTFAAPSVDRTARLSLFFGAVAGAASTGGDPRPNTIEISVDGVLVDELKNVLDSLDGEEWDTVNTDVLIPAGATSLTVQAFSDNRVPDVDALPASMV